MKNNIILIGLGTVGYSLIRLLKEKEKELQNMHDLSYKLEVCQV